MIFSQINWLLRLQVTLWPWQFFPSTMCFPRKTGSFADWDMHRARQTYLLHFVTLWERRMVPTLPWPRLTFTRAPLTFCSSTIAGQIRANYRTMAFSNSLCQMCIQRDPLCLDVFLYVITTPPADKATIGFLLGGV